MQHQDAQLSLYIERRTNLVHPCVSWSILVCFFHVAQLTEPFNATFFWSVSETANLINACSRASWCLICLCCVVSLLGVYKKLMRLNTHLCRHVGPDCHFQIAKRTLGWQLPLTRKPPCVCKSVILFCATWLQKYNA